MEDLFEFYLHDSKKKFSGWDFSYVSDTDRIAEFPLDWSYTSKIIKKLRNANSLLDMGTGGGEFLSLLKPLPVNSYATEGYEPNLPIAKERLEPLGVNVVKVEEDNKLDFEDNYFDLVINRHEEYSAKEVKRVLKQNGYFITQQVGGKNCVELNKILDYDGDFGMPEWQLDSAVNELKKEELKIIEKHEDFPGLRFYDIGAIIYYLKAVPWQIPDFSVDNYYDSLKKLHTQIQEKGYIDIEEHRFLIVAKK
ncbi:MAG TPA: class I SAM-dependent methyltransferase [Halanaerobiales bacterium]|nr:class I SAM-dependent methyltransferase [Halanaerobiales bacterium]